MDVEKRLLEDAKSFAEEVEKGFDGSALMARIIEHLGITPDHLTSNDPPTKDRTAVDTSVDMSL